MASHAGTKNRDQALPKRASVVIVGGGAIGTSACFHLAEAGVSDVLLIERDQLGAGSTSRAAGGIRAQFADALNIAIAQRSIEAFMAFQSRPGWHLDFKRTGYLFLLTRQNDLREFETSLSVQHALGVPSRILTADQAKQLCPVIEVDDVLAATFSSQDGHATPEAVVAGYSNAARALGAQLHTLCELLQINTRGGEICEVVTSKGRVQTDTVICAAGAWSSACAEMVGIDLPVTPLRRQILYTEPIAGLPARLPMTIDFETSFYFHREGPGVLIGMSDHAETPGFDTSTSDEWIAELMPICLRRAPILADAGIRGGWAGLYEMTPDHNALIGESQSVSRFLYASGFSGHGFLQSPAVGEILRDLYLRNQPFVDVSPLSCERFATNEPRFEFNVI